LGTTNAEASAQLAAIDADLDNVNSSRAIWGASQNRFENVIASLRVAAENSAASRGRIMDADYAQETANLSRTQILQQAGTAMVAQANQLPQSVLTLLRQ
jgi:flagellin